MVFITISDDNNIITSLDVHEDTEIWTITNIIENDFSLNMNINELTYNGNAVDKFDTIKKLNIKEGDLLFVRKKISADIMNDNVNNMSALNNILSTNNNVGNIGNIGNIGNNLNNENVQNLLNNPAFKTLLDQFKVYQENEYIKKESEILLEMKNDKSKMAVLKLQDEPLYNAIFSQNLDEIKKIVKEKYETEKKEKEKEQQMYENALKNPLSEDSQKFIYENIYKNEINNNLALAQEHFPEAFGVVFMLYIPVEINKNTVHAFVDSGAQSSIMSKKCAQKCNILRLMDKRFTGIAKGVGTKTILGKIHMIDIKIGNYFYAVSLTIIEDYDIDFIFGLDLLKRHQCLIDFKQNALIIEDNKIPFLSEKDVISISTQSIDIDANNDL